MKTLIKKLKPFYPNIKFCESDEPQLTDDYIYLNEDVQISVCGRNEYLLTIDNHDGTFQTIFGRQNEIFKSLVVTYKAICGEYEIDKNVVILEEQFLFNEKPEFNRWKYGRALDELKPQGRLMSFFINNEQQFLNC